MSWSLPKGFVVEETFTGWVDEIGRRSLFVRTESSGGEEGAGQVLKRTLPRGERKFIQPGAYFRVWVGKTRRGRKRWIWRFERRRFWTAEEIEEANRSSAIAGSRTRAAVTAESAAPRSA